MNETRLLHDKGNDRFIWFSTINKHSLDRFPELVNPIYRWKLATQLEQKSLHIGSHSDGK